MRSKLTKVVLMLALFGLFIPTTGCKLRRGLSDAGYSDDAFGFGFDFDLGSLFYDDEPYYDDYGYDEYGYDDYGYDEYDEYYYDDGFGFDDWDYWKGKKPGKKK